MFVISHRNKHYLVNSSLNPLVIFFLLKRSVVEPVSHYAVNRGPFILYTSDPAISTKNKAEIRFKVYACILIIITFIGYSV